MNYETRFLIALAETVAVEAAVLYTIFSLFWKKEKKLAGTPRILSASFIASCLTLPYLWFVLPAFLSHSFYALAGEAAVIVAEFFLLKRLLPISYQQAFVASLAANLTSVAIGRIF